MANIYEALTDIENDLKGFTLVTAVQNVLDKIAALKQEVQPVVEAAPVEAAVEAPTEPVVETPAEPVETSATPEAPVETPADPAPESVVEPGV